MDKSRKLRKNKMVWSIIILLGAIAVFASIIMYNNHVVAKKLINKDTKNLYKNNDKKSVEEKTKDNVVEEKKKSEAGKSSLVAKQKEKNKLAQASSKQIVLTKVQEELKEVYPQVQSPKEKQILSLMISTVGKLKANPLYNSSKEQALIKSIYSKLDADSKDSIKFILFTSIDGESIQQLKQSFGL